MRTFAAIILICCSPQGAAQSTFDNYFIDKVLRFDLMFAGNSQKTLVYPAGMKEEPFWAGSNINLIDPFNYGNFKYELFDLTGNNLIYSTYLLMSSVMGLRVWQMNTILQKWLMKNFTLWMLSRGNPI